VAALLALTVVQRPKAMALAVVRRLSKESGSSGRHRMVWAVRGEIGG